MDRKNPRRQVLHGRLLGTALGLILIGGMALVAPEANAQQSQESQSAQGSESEQAIHPDVVAGLENLQQAREEKKAEVAAGLAFERRERAATRAEIAAGLELERRHRAARKAEVMAGLELEKREREAKRAEVSAGLAVEQAGRAAGRPPAPMRPGKAAPVPEESRLPDAEPEVSGRVQSTFTRHLSGDAECIDRSGYTCDALADRAANGNAYAMYWLGVLTYEGNAFRKDEERGRKWIAQAKDGGFAPASRWLQDNPKPAE